MITAYYNEFDPHAAAWLRQLIKDGHITQGIVDDRSITEVKAADLKGFDRHHFFAGIAVWDHALNRCNWGDKKVWTASLPCQPFSTAGKGRGFEDDRHLLPHFLELVREFAPDTILGEQVDSAIRHGWLDDLQTNLEAQNYAVGHVVLGAHSAGAPQIRQRLYWVADTLNERSQGRISGRTDQARETLNRRTGSDRAVVRMDDTDSERSQSRRIAPKTAGHGDTAFSAGHVIRLGDTEHPQYTWRVSGYREEPGENFAWTTDQFAGSSHALRVDDTQGERWAIRNTENDRSPDAQVNTSADTDNRTHEQSRGLSFTDARWIYCRDGKFRPVEPCILPLAHGSTRAMVQECDSGAPINANSTQEARTMRLKGYGNAIHAGCATLFINAFMDSISTNQRQSQ